jgi:soluble lytic murein transglycosylase-like protein
MTPLLILAVAANVVVTDAEETRIVRSIEERVKVVGAKISNVEIRQMAIDILEAHEMWNVPEALIQAVIENECHYQCDDVGQHHDYGCMQVKRITAREVARLIQIPAKRIYRRLKTDNINIGTAYLFMLHKRFKTWPRALSAYNKGPRGFIDDDEKVSRYARRVLRRYRRIKRLLRNVPKRRS